MARYQAGIKTEARIIQATRELLGESGLDGATLKAICERAGVRAGSFYNLFDNKEELLLRVIIEAITALDPDPEGETDTLEELVDAYIAFFRSETTLARIYVQIAVSGSVTNDGIGGHVLNGHKARAERFAAAMQRREPAMGDADAQAAAELLLATLNGLAFRWSLDPSFDFETHARRALRTTVTS